MNGNLIGAVNLPALSSATGVWDLEEAKLARQQSIWPVLSPPDPYFEYVSLLLSGDTAATNGAQNNTFLDSSTNNFTITRNGNTTQGSFSPGGSNWSAFFDGGTNRVTTGTSSQFNLSGVDFTVECFVFARVLPTSEQNRLITIGPNDVQSSFTIAINTNGGVAASVPFSTGGSAISSANTLPLNTWTHIAFSLSSNTGSLYVNGIRVAVSSGWNITSSNNNYLYVGYDPTATVSAKFTGYVSNVRLVVGSALYSGTTITVPTTNLTAVSGTRYLSLQSNRFIDNSTNNFSIGMTGSVYLTKFNPFNPSTTYSSATDGSSGYFDGSGDNLSIAQNSAFLFGSGDFTIESWCYVTNLSTGRQIVGFWSDTNGANQSYLLYAAGSAWIFVIQGTGAEDLIILNASTSAKVGEWTHVAVSRSGSTMRMFINGTIASTGTYSGTLATPGNNLGIGVVENGASTYWGYMYNLRIVKGTAVYTSNFTPSVQPLSAIANTSLLLTFTNAGIIDATGINELETVGNAQVNTTTKKYGSGSYYFDGTGDYLNVISIGVIGTTDFTCEGWFYHTSAGQAAIWWDTATSGYASSNFSIRTDYIDSSRIIYCNVGVVSTVFSYTNAVVFLNNWVHVALVRSGNTLKLYLNGNAASGTGTLNTTSVDLTNFKVAGAPSPTSGYSNFTGYISDFRFTRGIARYTANFTPPTTSLPRF